MDNKQRRIYEVLDFLNRFCEPESWGVEPANIKIKASEYFPSEVTNSSKRIFPCIYIF